jgi:hypothetical protein
MSQGIGLNALQRISSEPRSGPHPKFSAEQYCQIMAIALEAPKATGRAISHWTAEKSKLTAFLESKSDGFRLHFFKKRCSVHTRTPPHAARG